MKLPTFSSRPAHTFLYITEAKTFRINTNRKGEVLGELQSFEFRCDSANGIPATLEYVIECSAKLGKKLWIIYVRLSTSMLSLPSIQVTGVEEETLQQALLFEYESLTGQSIAQSHLAYQFIADADEMSSYWVTVLAKETYTKINESLKAAKCQLAGVLHPGGLSKCFSAEETPSWVRLEAWSNSYFAITRNPETGIAMAIILPEQSSHWQDELNHWLTDIGTMDKSETIINNKIEILPETDENYHLRENDGQLDLWLAWWAEYLLNTAEPAIPLLNIQRKLNLNLISMLGGGGLALALCTGHFTWNLYQRNDFEFQTEALKQTESDIKLAKESIAKRRTQIAQLQKKNKLLRDNVVVIPTAMTALQRRPMALLKSLAEHTPKDVIVESISINKNLQIVIVGVSLQPQYINQLASNVKTDFSALGWQMRMPEKTDLLAFEEGGPWEFTLVLVDKGLSGFAEVVK